jgi:polar amino acid transport system ATP-binding protein
LTGINLSVEAGDVTCIISPSGSGKSTLLRCLNYLDVPYAGAAFLNGEPVGMRLGSTRCHSTSSRFSDSAWPYPIAANLTSAFV